MPEPKLTTAQRQWLTERAHACCEYCVSQARFSPDPFSVEHIIPKSAVDKLQLNRVGVVNLRRVLRVAGEHPPDAARPASAVGIS